jgi:hypothetical protein
MFRSTQEKKFQVALHNLKKKGSMSLGEASSNLMLRGS